MTMGEGSVAAGKRKRNPDVKKNVANDSLSPVLSGHKQLIANKLAEEEAERKVKGEAKKEKHLIAEKGHVKPANYLDSHEKFMIGIATKGVVKLFNAVNKAQKAQKGLDPSRSKDAKVIRKRKKEAFFSELGKTSLPAHGSSSKGNTSSDPRNEEGPAWVPLRDNYMQTNPKLKDWDKVGDSAIVDDVGRMSEESGGAKACICIVFQLFQFQGDNEISEVWFGTSVLNSESIAVTNGSVLNKASIKGGSVSSIPKSNFELKIPEPSPCAFASNHGAVESSLMGHKGSLSGDLKLLDQDNSAIIISRSG
ncbi:hypothetical protein V6N13_143767 [Hibiscus sabdariffa]